MVREHDFIAIFHSIHRVMKVEKLLKARGAEILLIPVPRQLTSDCGLAIRFDRAEHERVIDILSSENLLPAELYRREGKDYLQVPVAPDPGAD